MYGATEQLAIEYSNYSTCKMKMYFLLSLLLFLIIIHVLISCKLTFSISVAAYSNLSCEPHVTFINRLIKFHIKQEKI